MLQLSVQKPYNMLLKHVAMEEYVFIEDHYHHAFFTTMPYAVVSYCHLSLFGDSGIPGPDQDCMPRAVLLLLTMFDHSNVPRDWMNDILVEYEKKGWDFGVFMDVDDEALTVRLQEALETLFQKRLEDYPDYFVLLSFSGLFSHLMDIFLELGMSACFETSVELTYGIQEVWSRYRMPILLADFENDSNWNPQHLFKPYREIMDDLGSRHDFNDYYYENPYRGGGFSCTT